MNNCIDKIRLIATDLDGTLLRSDKSISEKDRKTLEVLASKKIVRVAATGRSLFKVKQVLPENAPFDFIVFSSGAGVYDWKNHKILNCEQFSEPVVADLCKHLLDSGFNFFVFKPIPNNNLFWYHRGAGACVEFDNYLARHEGDFNELDLSDLPAEAGQMMAVIPNNDSIFEKLKNEIYEACEGLKVIRATSPVNPAFTWFEIFPDTVSKGHGIKWLCNFLDIDQQFTAGVGNDYNDTEMFEFVAHPFVLKNGVEALTKKYRWVGKSNDEDGFSAVVEYLLAQAVV